MLASEPKFPFDRLRKLSRREAAFESTLAGWLAARGNSLATGNVAKLVEAPVRARIVAVRGGSAPSPSMTALTMLDPNAAVAEVRVQGQSIVLVGASPAIRQITQRSLGGPDELRAPRPLDGVEQAMWSLVVASALVDLGIVGEVWPVLGPPTGDALIVEILAESPAFGACTVLALCPPSLPLQVPPTRLHAWHFDVPIAVARSVISRDYVPAIRPGDIVTVDAGLALIVGEGRIGLRAAPGALEAAVATGYVPRDMAVLDEAHIELTVQLGTKRMTLRQIGELSPGQIIPLGRALAGPYEVRAGGRLVGHGELVDVEGELGVRIVSVAAEE